jgi:hypothetical protein
LRYQTGLTENNLDPDEKLDPYFKVVYHEKATTASTKIEEYIEGFLSV